MHAWMCGNVCVCVWLDVMILKFEAWCLKLLLKYYICMYLCMHGCVGMCVCVCDLMSWSWNLKPDAWRLCSGVYMYMYLCMHGCVGMCVCVCVWCDVMILEFEAWYLEPMLRCICMYVCMHACMKPDAWSFCSSRVYMYVSMHVCVCVGICVCVTWCHDPGIWSRCRQTLTCKCMRIYIYIYIYEFQALHMCMYACQGEPTTGVALWPSSKISCQTNFRMNMHVHIYVCMYIYIYIHTHTLSLSHTYTFIYIYMNDKQTLHV